MRFFFWSTFFSLRLLTQQRREPASGHGLCSQNSWVAGCGTHCLSGVLCIQWWHCHEGGVLGWPWMCQAPHLPCAPHCQACYGAVQFSQKVPPVLSLLSAVIPSSVVFQGILWWCSCILSLWTVLSLTSIKSCSQRRRSPGSLTNQSVPLSWIKDGSAGTWRAVVSVGSIPLHHPTFPLWGREREGFPPAGEEYSLSTWPVSCHTPIQSGWFISEMGVGQGHCSWAAALVSGVDVRVVTQDIPTLSLNAK